MSVLDKFLSDATRLQHVNETFSKIKQQRQLEQHQSSTSTTTTTPSNVGDLYDPIPIHQQNNTEFQRLYRTWVDDWDRIHRCLSRGDGGTLGMSAIPGDEEWRNFCVGSLYAMYTGIKGQRPSDGQVVQVVQVDPYVRRYMIQPKDLFKSTNALKVLRRIDRKKDLGKKRIEKSIEQVKNLHLKALYYSNSSSSNTTTTTTDISVNVT